MPELTTTYMQQKYPSYLQLVQAQVFFRHGERAPVKPYLYPENKWLYCERANRLHSEFMKAIGQFLSLDEDMPPPKIDTAEKNGDAGSARRVHVGIDGLKYEPAKWSIRLGEKPSDGENSGAWDPRACQMGQLSDVGLDTLYRSGAFLRKLYIDKLELIPNTPTDNVGDWLYVRATDYSRVIQSTHALLAGIYPGYPRASSSGQWPSFDKNFLQQFPIHTRHLEEETMHGNFACDSFRRHFTDIKIADARQLKWLDDLYRQTEQLPEIGGRAKLVMDRVCFASNYHPIFDEIMSMIAHGQAMPAAMSREHLDALGRASKLQWMGVVSELNAQRLGFGRLLDDIVQTMHQAVGAAESGAAAASIWPKMGTQRQRDLLLSHDAGVRSETESETPRVPRLALYGAHDITLGPLSIILGASAQSNWLPFASMLTIELFKDSQTMWPEHQVKRRLPRPPTLTSSPDTPAGYFVRVKLDDTELQLPTCLPKGKHHPTMGPSMCSLEAFYEHLAPVVPLPQDADKECRIVSPPA
ncbi:phosphoglycerate mutase-like protein [Coemansia reversa NRRL 1564]|uniref:Phosphoglycerate mutase-like protein n=1 Tax=Coemansia reversa (strain ATCC 12441 / NRRL 1564) TaxID=763665 RepID=A0A2G5B517_COERN|nr:phosphoglycerate mutase-like protein [Coemansia reversa NRRL 1564]|eukprot:PIA14099.1 phosphoglycerate mutase-like protein [Coemansia reversa NRRL 1564]